MWLPSFQVSLNKPMKYENKLLGETSPLCCTESQNLQVKYSQTQLV